MKLTDYIANFISNISDAVFVGQGGNIIHVLDSLGKRKDIKEEIKWGDNKKIIVKLSIKNQIKRRNIINSFNSKYCYFITLWVNIGIYTLPTIINNYFH